MKNFYTKIQVADQGPLNFYFSDVSSLLSPKFWVTVKDNKGKPYLFDMRRQKGEWKIVTHQQMPEWIAASESRLADAIINQ